MVGEIRRPFTPAEWTARLGAAKMRQLRALREELDGAL
jgi:hypothetical protein